MASDLLEALKLPELPDHLKTAFPPCDPGVFPLGSRVLCQIRTVKEVSQGGIILSSETKETDQWNTQIARVIAVGGLAFRNRDTAQLWPEGAWAKPGDFVRVPRWGGDRWERAVEGQDEPALFVMFQDRELMGVVLDDPTSFKAYIL